MRKSAAWSLVLFGVLTILSVGGQRPSSITARADGTPSGQSHDPRISRVENGLLGATTINNSLTVTRNVTERRGQNIFSTRSIDNIVFVDGLKYTSLASAVTACGNTNACWIIDNLPETFSANPFASYTGPGMQVDLGVGTWTTNVQIVIPNKVQLVGSGRAGQSDNAGTHIKAGSFFPASTSMILLGNSSPSFATRVENMGIDCNNVTGAIGIENASAEEESGAHHVLVTGCQTKGIYFHSNGAQNSFIEDVEVLAGNATSAASTVGIEVDNVGAFRGVHGATINFTGTTGTAPTSLMIANSPGEYNDLNLENATNGIEVKTYGVEVHNIQDNSNVTNLITIDGGVQSFAGFQLDNSGANLINNLDNGHTFTQTVFPFYFYGIGSTRGEFYSARGSYVFGGAIPLQEPGSSMPETTSPSGTASFDVCYGDSTTHAVKCSYNNGAFSQLTRFLDAGPTYNAAGAQQTTPHIVEDQSSLSSGSPSTKVVTLSGSAAFTSSSTYHCTVTNMTTAADGLSISYGSGSQFTVTGPNTVSDSFSFVCAGD